MALKEYKQRVIDTAQSLVTLNLSQSVVIMIGLVVTLMLAYRSMNSDDEDKIQVADFVTFNTYILQIYFPLGFIGTFWRFIRQSWTDVELVLDILAID